MTLEEFLDRASSREVTDEMAFDLLSASPDGVVESVTTPARPSLPAGAPRRIRLDDPNVLDTLDKYWPPGA